MPNVQKKDIVQRLQDIYNNNDYVIFAHYHGLTSEQSRLLEYPEPERGQGFR